MNPYIEEKSGNVIRRTFSHLVENEELTWHRDREDRIVIPLNKNDWMVQFDNKLPKKLKTNEEYFIPKNVFHRVIKGTSDLVVEIIKTTFENDDLVVYEGKQKKGKKDACYYKVKSRYDVWPSAYGSGALVKCRKVGAANWGNKSDESLGDDIKLVDEKWSEKYKRSIDCNNPKGFSQKAHCQGRKKHNENLEGVEIYKENEELIKMAHNAITRTKGKDYAPDVHEIQAWIDSYLEKKDSNIGEEKKTDFSKEKEQGLHGWFARQGGEGKSQGWVDCNTCRKDPETGRRKCKPCGRESGEDRSKYPSCRPTPSACSTSGKGKKWGKTKENLQVSENISTFDKDFIKKVLKESFNQEDNMTEPMIEPQVKPQPKVVPAPDKVKPITPSRKNKPFLPMPGIQTDPKAIGK